MKLDAGLNTEITENGDAKSSTEMESQEFLDLLNQDDLWMLEHVYIMTKNTNIRKQFMDEIDEQNNVYCRHIFQPCMKSKQKIKVWR